MDSVVFKVLITVVALSVLIIIHEGGHYLAARAFGMQVLRFSIGFGPTLFRYQPKGSPTVFQVAVIPFLAYVQIAGMNPNEEVDPNDPELYPNKSLFARVTTIAAGPVANYLTASAIVFALGVTNNYLDNPACNAAKGECSTGGNGQVHTIAFQYEFSLMNLIKGLVKKLKRLLKKKFSQQRL